MWVIITSAGAGGDADGIEISDSCLPVYTEYQYSILISQSYKQDIVTSFSEGTSLCLISRLHFTLKWIFRDTSSVFMISGVQLAGRQSHT